MTDCRRQLEYRCLRAPDDNGALLVDPPFDEVPALVRENVRLASGWEYDFQGRRLADLSEQARQELLGQALRWTRGYRDVAESSAGAAELIFLAGHQPGLFHPGVWLKNFALARLARRQEAVAVNLLIDSDTVGSTAVAVPGGSASDPRAEPIPFDLQEPKLPYEERQIADRDMFSTFGHRAAERIGALVRDPLIERYWPLVLGQMQQTANLGASLAQARHQLEGRWAVESLEVPQSMVCDSEPFFWFAAHLLARIAEFSQVYNEAVREYRRLHRIRSAAHPVPDLAVDGRWFEAPFWIWTADRRQRRRPFVCCHRDRIVLSDRQSLEIELPLTPDRDASAAVERLIELRRSGVKIRSRALTTTLWARLALGNLFLHGIGGAKYDQLTDMLFERFFRLQAPGFMVLSATLHLPIAHDRVSRDDARLIAAQLRGLVYHPERFIDGSEVGLSVGSPNAAELIAAKARWIRASQTPQNARTRCRSIRHINQALQPWVESQRKRLLDLQDKTARALKAESVLACRDYAFCLYAEKQLRKFSGRLLPKNA